MWQISHNPPHTEFKQDAAELLQSTMRTLILSVGGAYLAWHVVATVSWPVELGWKVWSLTVIVLVPAALALVLLARHFLAAQLVWLVGLALAVTHALFVFQQPMIALFYAMLPLVAVVLLGWRSGLLVEGAIVIGLWWLAGSRLAPPLPSTVSVSVILVGATGWLLGWASMHSLTTVTQWSLFSFAQAQQHLEATQKHRAQLAQMVKDLDLAYYRLERANAALVAARKVAEDAERFKAEFVMNISHELRTPLNLIVGFSEVMMTAPQSYQGVQLPGVYRRDLNAIYRSAQHLLALVDDVLDMARIEAGKIALAHEEAELTPVVVEAVDTLRDYINAKGLTLHLDMAPSLPLLRIDRLRIRQVLLNLLVNAARFTDRGAVTVTVSRQEDEVMVRIKDTGRGIAGQDLSKIFEAFRSTEQPTSTWHSGTGLGLPISKKFVELHHGRMGVESTVGEGTTFWFTLPAQPPPPADPSIVRSSRWTPLVKLGASERIVVVAHDDPQVETLLKRQLSGYRVVGAANVTEGAEVAEELQAIALLMDERCPLPDAAVTQTPIIRCPLPSTRQTALALGAVDLLIKPVACEKLLAAIDAIGAPVRRLLIADDDPDMVRLFQRMLLTRSPTPECLAAHNGVEALEVLRQNEVDLILLDLAMPEMNGRGVLDQLALDPRWASIPVIIVSGHEQDYANLRLNGTIQVRRSEGFRLGEMIQTLEALFNALSPGWRQLETRASEPAEALAA